MRQNESAVATNEWVWLFGSWQERTASLGTDGYGLFVFFFFFLGVLSTYKSSKWQYLSTYIFVFTFYSMSYFDCLGFSCGIVTSCSHLSYTVKIHSRVFSRVCGPSIYLKKRTKNYWLFFDPPSWRFCFLFDKFTA